jgi:rhamnosyltransferase
MSSIVSQRHDPSRSQAVDSTEVMQRKDVLAIVVSYNGLARTRATVDALRGQVGHVHIVDNGSRADSLAMLDALQREDNVTVERLSRNCGVGYALNRGVQFAKERGFSWLLTMDQDSTIDAELMGAYRRAIARDPSRVVLAPAIVGGAPHPEPHDAEIEYAITSGNLVRVSLFDEVGPYDEGLFIDGVDFDFSLRVRKAGHRLHRVQGAVMHHELGDATNLSPFMRRLYAQHSALRRYYMSRNFLYLFTRYFREFPSFMIQLAIAHVVHLLLIAFLDPNPLPSYRAVGRGIKDFFAHKLGPYAEPV